MKRRTFLYAGGGLLVAAGAGFAWVRAERGASGFADGTAAANANAAATTVPPAAAPAEPAPDLFALELPDAQGKPHALGAWRGRPVLVNFWATWCPPCVKEMPELDALQARYPQVQFVGIGIDTASNIGKFSAKIPVSYPLLVAGPEGIDLIRGLGNTAGGLPFTIIFDKNGHVNRKILGQIEPGNLASSLDTLLV